MVVAQHFFSNVSNFTENAFTSYTFCALGWAGVYMPVTATFGILGLGICAGVYIVCLRGKISREDRGDLLVFNTILTVMIISHLLLMNAQIAGACSWISLHPVTCKLMSWIKFSASTALNLFLLFMSVGKTGSRGVHVLRLYGLVTTCFMLHPLITVTSGSVQINDEVWTEVCKYHFSQAIQIECLDFSIGTVVPFLLTLGSMIYAVVKFSVKTRALNKPSPSNKSGSTRKMSTKVQRTFSEPSTSSSDKETAFGNETERVSPELQRSSLSRRTKSYLDSTHTDLQVILKEIEKNGIFRKKRETLAFLTLFILYIVLLMPCRISDFALIVFNDQTTGLSLGRRTISNTIDYIGVIIDQLILLCPLLFPCLAFPVSFSALRGWTIFNVLCGVHCKQERRIRRQVPILKRDRRKAEMDIIYEERN